MLKLSKYVKHNKIGSRKDYTNKKNSIDYRSLYEKELVIMKSSLNLFREYEITPDFRYSSYISKKPRNRETKLPGYPFNQFSKKKESLDNMETDLDMFDIGSIISLIDQVNSRG